MNTRINNPDIISEHGPYTGELTAFDRLMVLEAVPDPAWLEVDPSVDSVTISSWRAAGAALDIASAFYALRQAGKISERTKQQYDESIISQLVALAVQHVNWQLSPSGPGIQA